MEREKRKALLRTPGSDASVCFKVELIECLVGEFIAISATAVPTRLVQLCVVMCLLQARKYTDRYGLQMPVFGALKQVEE